MSLRVIVRERCQQYTAEALVNEDNDEHDLGVAGVSTWLV